MSKKRVFVLLEVTHPDFTGRPINAIRDGINDRMSMKPEGYKVLEIIKVDKDEAGEDTPVIYFP